MNKINFHVLSFLLTGSVLLSSGCAVYPAQQSNQGYGYGPPPHAPAHGYRAKYQNRDMIYDAPLGAYVVVGLNNIYFIDDHYYRHSNDGWYYSRYDNRDWGRYDERKLPRGLAKKYRDNDRGRGGDRGHDDDRDHDYDRGSSYR